MKEYKQYKDYPEGSGGKKFYDSITMDTKDYLLKYFNNYESLHRWQKFYTEYVIPISDKKGRYEYKKMLYRVKPPFVVDFKRYDLFIEEIRGLNLDKEIYHFLAFLFSINFFKTIDCFFKWKKDKIFFSKKYSFDDIIKLPNGLNFIKSNLRELRILNQG